MVKHDKQDREDEDIIEEMQEEIHEIENEEGDISEEKLEDAIHPWSSDEIEKLKDALFRSQADFENFKKRTERDRGDMIFFLKLEIFKKILPRLDDLARMLTNTPEEMKSEALYQWMVALEKSLKKDLTALGVTPFDSLGQPVDPNKHEVMTQVPGETPWLIVDEFEKGYMLGDRVLRVAKVVVAS